MNARPILFSGPMIRALREGRKTQTRRIIKPQPKLALDIDPATVGPAWDAGFIDVRCPYGQSGDLLWVREAWRTAADIDHLNATEMAAQCIEAGCRKPWAPMQYEADQGRTNWDNIDEVGRYRHARFMPRWASRLTLRITGVRVQRLQEISGTDAAAEGVDHPGDSNPYINGDAIARILFRDLWESINGPGSWNVNPYVWALSFQVIHANIDQVLREAA